MVVGYSPYKRFLISQSLIIGNHPYPSARKQVIGCRYACAVIIYGRLRYIANGVCVYFGLFGVLITPDRQARLCVIGRLTLCLGIGLNAIIAFQSQTDIAYTFFHSYEIGLGLQ